MTTLVVGTNSYADSLDADDYIGNHFNSSAWSSLSLDEKEQILITGTFTLDHRFAPFVSEAFVDSQTLAFPRKEFTYFNPILHSYLTVNDNVVPDQIKNALYHLAQHFAVNKDLIFSGESYAEWTQLSLDGPSITRDTNNMVKQRTSLIPREVDLIMKPFVRTNYRSGTQWWRAN